jgi:hypothetical protein
VRPRIWPHSDPMRRFSPSTATIGRMRFRPSRILKRRRASSTTTAGRTSKSSRRTSRVARSGGMRCSTRTTTGICEHRRSTPAEMVTRQGFVGGEPFLLSPARSSPTRTTGTLRGGWLIARSSERPSGIRLRSPRRRSSPTRTGLGEGSTSSSCPPSMIRGCGFRSPRRTAVLPSCRAAPSTRGLRPATEPISSTRSTSSPIPPAHTRSRVCAGVTCLDRPPEPDLAGVPGPRFPACPLPANYPLLCSALPSSHITLHEPEIPNNTGNIGRTCVAAGSPPAPDPSARL